MRLGSGFLFTLLLVAASASAQEVESLGAVEVQTTKSENESHHISSQKNTNSDTASMLNWNSGVSLKTGGGISSLPVLQGMADDRVNIRVDGAAITSSCSNHMNPALSYIDPAKVDSLFVLPGITPVSKGGDSIGGSIIVKTKDLSFAEDDSSLYQKLNLRSHFKSNNENRGASLRYEVANERTSFEYAGLDETAHNYRQGKGKRLKGTLYNQNNQSLKIGRKIDQGVVALKFTRAVVPYQGFINQYMDLADNVSNQANLSFKGTLGSATIDSSVFYQHTNHLMDILRSERSGAMPMYTRSDEFGYSFKASFEVSSNHLLTVGSDYNRYRLDDWWPAVPGMTTMMGPGTFESINNGKRDRIGFFIESESDWSKYATSNFGIRTDIVSMNTGNVEGYNNTDNLPADAAAFNGKNHKKTDNNYDATFLTKFETSSMTDIEVGLGRKTRSPNLYERYAWAGSVTDPTGMSMPSMGASMDMLMINWFGDGNGYVGNINLKPEVAHKISTSFVAHDEKKTEWEVRLSPYYSEVTNFIDADFIGKSSMGGNNFLKFANHDAIVFGADFSAKAKVLKTETMGDFSIHTVAGYTRGYRRDGKAELYHLMPLNGKFALIHQKGKWTSDIVAHLVAKKNQVNDLRTEPKTKGYSLLDIGTSYQMSKLVKVDFAISNIFDLKYGLPLGGVDLVNHSRASNTPVAGMGRSFNTALSIDFF